MFNVRLDGRVLKTFENKEEAKQWAFSYLMVQGTQAESLNYIDQAVDVSDLNEAKEVIKHIMEL
jgi:hypothetical protein